MRNILKLNLVVVLVMSLMLACSPQSSSSGADSSAAVTYNFVSPGDTVTASTGTDVHILDVREADKFAKSRVANSVSSPIFPLEDASLEESLKAFALENLNDGKDIYIVCNSGKRGAEKATEVLTAAGIDKAKIFTVEGGAKALEGIDGAMDTSPLQ